MTTQNYNSKANELNAKFPSLNAEVKTSPWGGRLEIEVSTVDKAKALKQMFPMFTFTSMVMLKRPNGHKEFWGMRDINGDIDQAF